MASDLEAQALAGDVDGLPERQALVFAHQLVKVALSKDATPVYRLV